MSWTPSDAPAVDAAAIGRVCVRHPDSGYLDLLARLATSGDSSSLELLTLARDGSAGGAPYGRLGPDRLDADYLAGFALATAGMVGGGSTVQDVASLLELAHRASGPEGLPPRARALWLDALFLTGATERYPYPRPPSRPGSAQWRVDVDELNPYLDPHGEFDDSPVQRWLAGLNALFTGAGLAPVGVRPGAGPPLHRLMAAAKPTAVASPPLVSVIMPVFDPGAELCTALASILDQTWPHLEVLLCDDGSGPLGQQLLTDLATREERVRVLRQNRNQGPYAARNLGLAHAQGEFVTFQDADDWSHPQRVERQLQPLVDNPAVMATMSRMIRVDEHVAITMLGFPAGNVNASSLLFRRVPVLSRLGGFDTVRRAADNEFIGRLQAVFTAESLHLVPEVLALVQRTAGSLSRDDMRLLFKHPARELYRFCYRQWHDRIRAGAETGFVLPPHRAPVPAPPRISGASAAVIEHQELTVLAGFADNAPTSPDITTEVTTLARMTSRMALVQCPAPYDLTVPHHRPGRSVVQLIRTGRISWPLPGQELSTGLAVVRDPASVLYLGGLLRPLTAEAVLLVADYLPEGRYDPFGVETALAGVSPETIRWLPATATIAAALADRVADGHILPPRLWGAVPEVHSDGWPTTPQALVGVLPPSTRLHPDQLGAWARVNLPQDPATRVWCRAGRAELAGRFDRPVVPLRPTGLSTKAFLRQVSYLTVPPTPGRGPHLDRQIVCALRQGCVVLLDPSYREHFADAVLYSDDRPVDDWIALLARHPEMYRQQQERAARFLRTQLSEQALRAALTTVLDSTTGKVAHATH